MRGVTVAVVAVAVVVVAAVMYLRSGGPEPPPAPAPVANAPLAKNPEPGTTKHDDAGDRSSRVEERLGQLREDFERRQGAPEAPKRAMPTVADSAQRKAMEANDEADDDGDDEDPEEMEQLKHTLLTDPDPDERIGAVLMLTGEEGPRSLSMLLEAMGDPDPEVRLAVVEALGDRSEDLSPETLIPALKDSDPEVRFEAVSILGDIEDNPQALDLVRAAQNDPDPDTAALAQGILDELDQTKPQPGQPQNAQQHK